MSLKRACSMVLQGTEHSFPPQMKHYFELTDQCQLTFTVCLLLCSCFFSLIHTGMNSEFIYKRGNNQCSDTNIENIYLFPPSNFAFKFQA